MGAGAGPKDNRKLEKRSDVLCYTSIPLERDYTIVGSVSVDLYIESNLEVHRFLLPPLRCLAQREIQECLRWISQAEAF